MLFFCSSRAAAGCGERRAAGGPPPVVGIRRHQSRVKQQHAAAQAKHTSKRRWHGRHRLTLPRPVSGCRCALLLRPVSGASRGANGCAAAAFFGLPPFSCSLRAPASGAPLPPSATAPEVHRGQKISYSYGLDDFYIAVGCPVLPKGLRHLLRGTWDGEGNAGGDMTITFSAQMMDFEKSAAVTEQRGWTPAGAAACSTTRLGPHAVGEDVRVEARRAERARREPRTTWVRVKVSTADSGLWRTECGGCKQRVRATVEKKRR